MLFRRRPDPLGAIDEHTPHRFAVLLAASDDAARAADVVGKLSRELSFVMLDTGRIEISSTFSPRTAAVQRPLNALRCAGVGLAGFEFLDVVEMTDERRLGSVVRDWMTHANRGPARRRAEALGGKATLDTLYRIVAATEGDRSNSAARFVFGCAAFNTAGSEQGTLAMARAAGNGAAGADLVGLTLDRTAVAALTGTAMSFDVDDLVAVLSGSGYTAQRAMGLVHHLPTPLDETVRRELVRLVSDGPDDVAALAVGALARAEPDEALRELLDRLVDDAPTSIRGAALATASHHWGVEMRPRWTALLASRSAPLREAAEESLGMHGNVDDLPLAAEHLAKLVRRKPGAVSWHVPREAPLIELLLRHRGHPIAEASFTDLFDRWERLNPDLHDWIRREHPTLVPAQDDTSSAATPSDAVDDLMTEDNTWPLPAIEVHDGVHELWFEDTDMFDTKDRFGELCDAHRAIEVLAEDREVLHLRITDPDPVALITRLWSDAGGDPVP